MISAQHTLTCQVFLHPTACSRAKIDAFQRSTGLRIIATTNGNAKAVPASGGAA